MSIPVYPLDLTGNALTNHIVGEVRAITSNIERFIVPVGGPFYTVTMVVRNNVTNAILLPNTQYKILHHIPEASQDSGKNVCAVVYITDATVPAVRLEYQVVGGQYQNMVPLIMQLISEHPLDPDAPDQIGWGQIFGMPNQYPPTAHIHPASQFLGYADLVMALENLRVAVANGDNLAISAIYRYIELMFSSSQYVTADQLNSLLITPEPFVKVHPTYAALKQRDDMVANLAVVYATIGRAQSNDGLGMLFRWDSLSTATPDEKYILRPNHILGNDPGRFISLSWTQNVLDRHGIDAAVAAFSMVPDNADLDTLKTPSKMWVQNTQVNRPFDYGVLEITLVGGTIDVPAEVHQRMYWDHREATRNCNHLGVWSVWTFVKSRFLVIERNLNTNAVDLDTVVEPNDYYYGDGCSNRPTQYGLLNVRIETHDIVYHIAHGADNTVHTRYRANNGTWTRWKKLMDEVEMERHGINTAIALHNQLAVNVNLDNVLTPGKFYIGNHTEPSPGLHGILEVELISGTIDAPGEAEQTFKRSSSTSLFATRRRYWNGTSYDWDQWMFRAMRNGETDQVFHAAAPAIGTEQGTHVVNIAMQNTAFALLWNRLTINGIDADLAVSNMLDNVDLNSVTAVGDYYYNQTCSNKPPLYGNYGLMEVRRENAIIVYQKVHTSENWYYTRYRGDGITWTPWRRYIDADTFDTFVTNTNSALGTLASAIADILARPRVITLPATTLFDLNLKTYHDMIYGGEAPANSSVEFIVPNGCLVTASTTSLYAITNPNSWASGVTTKIKVEAGGFVAGRGGDGGRGGRGYTQYVDSDGDTHTNYIGGNAANPSSVIHGKKGGNAIRTFRALVVENLGFIGVGSGGGGASGGGVIGFSSTNYGLDRIAVSGNGGGGGWPLGRGGNGGQIRLDDSSQAEYYQNEGSGGFRAWHVSGNPGENAGGYGSHTTLASGGAPISRTNGNSVLSHGAGGGGGLSALTQYSTGGGGSSWTNVSWVQIGDAGNGGDDGDYAINATGGSVTFVGPSGNIRGLVI